MAAINKSHKRKSQKSICSSKLVKNQKVKNKKLTATIINYLENIIALTPGHVYWKDIAGRYLGCNNNVAESTGLSSPSEIVGMTDEDIAKKLGWPLKYGRAHFLEDMKVIETGKPIYNLETPPLKRFDGTKQILLGNKVPIKDENDKVIGVVGISIDITARKKMELELKKAKEQAEEASNLKSQLIKEERNILANFVREFTGQKKKTQKSILEHVEDIRDYFNNIIALIPGHVYWKNADGYYLGCNDNLVKSIGLSSRAEIIGMTDEDIAKKLGWPLKYGKTHFLEDLKVIKTGKPIYDVVGPPLMHADGVKRMLLTNKVPIKDKNGEVIGVVGISIDITSRRKMEENLKKAKEQAEKANKLKSEFISNMEHDLRTPSSGIMGMTKILEEQETDSNKKEILHLLSQASERLLNILNGIVAFDKAEAGIIPTTDQEFSIKKTIDDILAMEQPYVFSKKLELTAEYDKNVPEIVIGDEQRIFRVLLNLVGNAVKFTKKGHITIYVKIPKVIDQQNIILQLIVEDTGIGIPKNKIQDIYERFVRGTPSNRGLYEGSGLGLSVVKRFIEDMGGEINAESVVNKGTKFTCNIPIKLPLSSKKITKTKSTKAKGTKKAGKIKNAKKIDKTKPKQKTKTAKTTKATETTKKSKIVKTAKTIKPKKSGIRVLLVEDDILAQTLASNMIKEKLTNNLDVADSGEKAIKLTGKNKYDLIFMDIGLPNTKGYDVTRKIRKSKTNKNQKTVIVALTAHVSQKEKKKCLDAQMNYFLTKPLNNEKIEEVLKTLLSEKTTKTTKKEASKTKISEKISTDSDLLKIEGKVIDLKLGMEKLSCDAKQAKKTIELFIKLLKEDMPKLTEAKNKGDWKIVKDLAHKHRGGSLYCGVPRLQQAFTNLEHYLITEKTELRGQLYQQLLDEIDKLYAAQEKA